jgi:CRP/FNR family transcriptional regulator
MPPRLSSDVEILRRVAYFRSLPGSELQGLAAACRARALRPGDTLFEEGEPCRGLFIVADGTVAVRQISFRGREQVFHTEGPGATLGEAPLFDRGGYVAAAVALTAGRVLLLPRPQLIALCQRRPEVALAMLETMAGRVRRFAELVADLAFRPVTERLARHLDALRAGGAGPEIRLALTQAQLAARLGTVRELVARALGQLERSGIIARSRSTIVVRDSRRLSALARGEDPPTET